MSTALIESKTIKTGMTLKARSIGDHDCIYTVHVIERKPGSTMATVKVDIYNRVKRCKVHAMPDGEEYMMCHGRFSMAPMFRASSV